MPASIRSIAALVGVVLLACEARLIAQEVPSWPAKPSSRRSSDGAFKAPKLAPSFPDRSKAPKAADGEATAETEEEGAALKTPFNLAAPRISQPHSRFTPTPSPEPVEQPEDDQEPLDEALESVEPDENEVEIEDEPAEESASEASSADAPNPFNRAKASAPPAKLRFSVNEAELEEPGEAGEVEIEPSPRGEQSILKSYDVQPTSGEATAAGEAPKTGEGNQAAGERNEFRSTTPRPNGAATAALLELWLKPPAQRALAGRPLTLVDALRGAPDRARQLAVIKAYWTVSHCMADYHQSLGDSQTIAALPRPTDERELSAWKAASAVAEAREREAELAAVAAQHDLAIAASLTGEQELPLASDAPFVGAYGTKFQALFAGRPAPENVRRIDQTLPLAQRLIEARTSATTALEAALAQQAEAYRTGQSDLGAVLAAHAAVRDQRRALLETVRDYNRSIADYALFVATPGLDRSVVVKMLIVDKSTQSVLKRRGDQQLATEQSAAPAARTAAQPTPAGALPRKSTGQSGQFVPKDR